jgi:hypothetical protein
MKQTTCILFSFSILFVGCFTEASLTKDEAAPDDTKVFFYLKDGSFIKSYANHHKHVDGGYKVAGDLFPLEGFRKTLDGVLDDTDIVKITRDEFNSAGTFLGIGIAAMTLAGAWDAVHSGFSIR